MEKPEDVPQDVWLKADVLASEYRGVRQVEMIARAILSAVEEERVAILQFEFDLPIRQNGADMMIDIREYIHNRKGA